MKIRASSWSVSCAIHDLCPNANWHSDYYPAPINCEEIAARLRAGETVILPYLPPVTEYWGVAHLVGGLKFKPDGKGKVQVYDLRK